MSGKILFCATVDVHFKAFHLPYLKWFKDQGWEVHLAASGDMNLPFVDKKYNIPIQRSPFRWQNWRAYRDLKKMMEENKYQLIHCHTPMGGVLSRLAARRARKSGTKVIYTAHGFHFCKGAPLLNWLLYYPIERGLAHYTDCLITINQEDYHFAMEKRFKAKRIEHVHGVGVNSERFKPIRKANRDKLRGQFGYRYEDFLMFYAAEFNGNKNQQFLIHALALIKDEVPTAKLLLAGEGPNRSACQELAVKLGVEKRIDFLGYRDDIELLLPLCDIAVASSLREGLPVNIMEAMACGLPIIASDNRGHRELVRHNDNGWIVSLRDIQGMAEKMKALAADNRLKKRFGRSGRKLISGKFTIGKVLDEKRTIYSSFMNEQEVLEWAVR
jgi:glycosyltransferase EpsD